MLIIYPNNLSQNLTYGTPVQIPWNLGDPVPPLGEGPVRVIASGAELRMIERAMQIESNLARFRAEDRCKWQAHVQSRARYQTAQHPGVLPGEGPVGGPMKSRDDGAPAPSSSAVQDACLVCQGRGWIFGGAAGVSIKAGDGRTVCWACHGGASAEVEQVYKDASRAAWETYIQRRLERPDNWRDDAAKGR